MEGIPVLCIMMRAMKVFISWSGDTSHRVALALRDWLPSVLQSIEPYVSSEDIEKGARWSTDVGQQLSNTSFGILCVTRGNLDSAWLNFEAGALSKSLESSRVSPFLVGIRVAELVGPLSQFQATLPNLDDVTRLVKSMNSADERPIEEARLVEAVRVWWPGLEQRLASVQADQDEGPLEPQREPKEMIEELLEITRGIQRQFLQAEAIELPASSVSSSAQQRRRDLRQRQVEAEVVDILDAAEVVGTWKVDDDRVRIHLMEEPSPRVVHVLDRIAAKYGRDLEVTTSLKRSIPATEGDAPSS